MNGALLAVIAVTVIPAFLVSVIAVGWIARHAQRLGLLDRPNARKVHTNPTPLGGGIGIWLGVVAVFAAGTLATVVLSKNPALGDAWLPESLTVYLPGLVSRIGSIWFLILAGTILMVLGLLDDRYGLDWRLRLGIEFGVASAVVYGQHLQLTAYINAPWLTSILSVFWIVMLINAFNMLDNMDALSGGVASIICAMLSIMLVTTPESEIGQPQWFVAAMMLTLLGGLLGFLKHNRPPAKIFMGDAGSYFVGYWIAIGTLLSTYPGARGDTPHAVLAPLCLLAIPLYDMVSVIWIRVREGRSPFQADKKHFSHRLVELGMTKTQAVATICLATLTCSLGALILPRTDLIGAGIVLAIVLAMLALIAVLESLTSGSER
ncbi:MAG: undecaprenyl/decaprenyl-phosphate alpha-N-acetylglucosaminyl 1-phosphate transferase [Pirellula sp.]|jgi:UDP-GlcNAc:undecaprenyl-phosphate GlcNAc-1-phosphate transferase|nr:undecaprenyl/decaprenyl-phosphate alpha-N-acetylglucosaminyl 1-phosphate transferase [Pirellula sp.]